MGERGDAPVDYRDVSRMFYAKLFPEMQSPFLTHREAQAALSKLRAYLSEREEKWAKIRDKN